VGAGTGAGAGIGAGAGAGVGLLERLVTTGGGRIFVICIGAGATLPLLTAPAAAAANPEGPLPLLGADVWTVEPTEMERCLTPTGGARKPETLLILLTGSSNSGAGNTGLAAAAPFPVL
jgi:hypothetical protein